MPTWATGAASRNPRRPARDQRHAHAALPHRVLAVEERRVARQPLTAVVLRVDHQRVAREVVAIERRQDLADALVGALEHRDIVRTGAGVGIMRLNEPRVTGRDRRLVGHLERPVRGVVGDLEEERLVLVVVDELHRPVGDQIGHVAFGLHRRAVLVEIGLSLLIGVLVVVHQPRQEAPEVVEAVRVRAELRLVAQVPLADESGGVAGVLDQARQRPPGGRQPTLGVGGGGVAHRPLDPRALVVAAAE